MANDGFLMKNAAGEGGNYAPESMIEAVPLTQMGSTAEFVEVRAPSALGPGYELTVNVLGGLCVVLVVSERERERAHSVESGPLREPNSVLFQFAILNVKSLKDSLPGE